MPRPRLRAGEIAEHVSTRIPVSAFARLRAAGGRRGLGPSAVLARLVLAWSDAHCEHGVEPGERCRKCAGIVGGVRLRVVS